MRMTTELNENHGDATILLFGPQVLSFNRRSLEKLRSMLSDGPARRWMLDTVTELPSYWDALIQKIPNMAETNPGQKLLTDLDLWLRQGLNDGQEDITNLPNMILTPLVVLTQLTQYWRYLELSQTEYDTGRNRAQIDLQADLLKRQTLEKKFETLGFCTGLLSAFAVASSSTQDEFEKYGAVAIRLAMLVGALVDAQEVWNKKLGQGWSKSYATAWRNLKQGEEMHRIVDSLFPDAYVSVLYDEARATVTTSERTAPLLLQRLRAAGITAAEVGLKGHFHNPNEETSHSTEALIELCDSLPGLQFPNTAHLALPSYTNTASGEPIDSRAGSMHNIALRAILIQQCNWYGTFSAVQTARLKGLIHGHEKGLVVSFGPDRCVPPTLMRRLGPRLVHFTDLDEDTPQLSASVLDPEAHSEQRTLHDNKATQGQINIDPTLVDEDAIAVVGMSIKVAGADDVDEFSQMMKTGVSQHELIDPDRMMFDTLFREGDNNQSRKWYGNFIRDMDAFDHKFFKRSPRESSTMDPQQRLFLQAAYQAVEQSGYFTEPETSDGRDKRHVGVYLGACAGDYEHHIACHGANAFTATGNLKSFIPGKVSHYFGWTGPSLTLDTACSASTVALHIACRNLLSGECTAAIAGGVGIMTNFLWFQNLAGASFLSPTGQCKPFDELADGYCRAEGIACVFLKKMTDAIADGNPILGCIASTGVNQNQNCTPLFVPNSPSLSQLFKDVMQKAKVTPQDISLVEAHGTGTPVGDPAEYESIRIALGGPIRSKPLAIGSVKGHIGHTEGASGVISLIKIIMMMQESYIPPQASFSKMSHYINVTPSDMMEVPTSLRSWSEEYKVALINNYGASGSNASMVVTQSPHSNSGLVSAPIRSNENTARFPFWVSGFDARSIGAYSSKLLSFLRVRSQLTLADIAFSMNRQSNRSLAQGLIFNCRSVAELNEKLSEVASAPNPTELGIAAIKPERPVILCFGGQVSTYVGLDRNLYDSVSILRHHLDQCDAVIQSLGINSIYPEIFERASVQDTVKLQTMLFAMQYACAKSWIDSGLSNKIVSVVGHSFGEITALCVSSVLSLRDTIKLVAGRARLVRDTWGPDPGVMMAVEADEVVVKELLVEASRGYDGHYSANIACYNGPRSFTLAGSGKAIDLLSETMLANKKFSAIKSKKLNVTNAFHSTLVEPLVDNLEQVGNNVNFNEPVIPFERATETKFVGKLTSKFVRDHMREPVFFNHAVQRLAKEYPSAIFLEAGSSSTITIMASRALAGLTTPDSHHFQALSITNDKGLDGLTDATVSLWKQGIRVAFWAHHALQTYEYATLQLPPYQFEKARHWQELKSPAKAVEEAVAKAVASGAALGATAQHQIQDERSLGLFIFDRYRDEDQNGTNGKGVNRRPRFRINTSSEKYRGLISGHLVAQTAPICPATLEVDMAIEALFSLHPEWKDKGLLPVVHDMANHAPICVNDMRTVWLDFEALDDNETVWGWEISSTNTTAGDDPQKHVDAQLRIRSPSEAAYQAEFARMERLVSHSRCTAMLGLDLDDDGVDVLQGRNVYRTFGEIVDYGEPYRGVKTVIGRGDECAGRVHKQHSGETWLDVLLSDSFCQVGGMWVNCMTDRNPNDMYIAVGCEISMRSPRTIVKEGQDPPDKWHVFARHTHQSDKFGMLTEASMSKMLTRLTTDESVLRNKPPTPTHQAIGASQQPENSTDSTKAKSSSTKTGKKKEKKVKPSSRPDITNDAEEILLDSEMADVGIDSLMGMELAREVESVFKCTLDQEELMEATSLRKFVVCISNALYGPDQGGAAVDADDQDEENEDDSSSAAAADDTWSETGEGDSTDTSTSGIESSPAAAKPAVQEPGPTSNAPTAPAVTHLKLSQSDILECFGEVKMLTDKRIREFHLDNIEDVVIAATNRLCAALVVEAFEELGCPLRTAAAGDALERVSYLPQHERLMKFVYEFLENDARLVDIDVMSGQLTRTNIAVPRKTSDAILQELLGTYPEFRIANRLTYYAGKNLAGVLTGKTDGIRVIFGSVEGRELVQALYCEHTFNRMNYGQMRDTIDRLIQRVRGQQPGETLKILEMGAGTGGTTYVLAPFLASLDVPVEYTFTDLSPSMVANARRKFGKQYSFMRFAVHDIEKPPADELKGQHIVIASNAVHATHDLVVSGTNIRSALRSDGFLMMLEMTEVVPFIDLIFGLLEGWWLFNDGRKHAIIPGEHWEHELHTAGFGHVDWTDGTLPENNFQKVMIALASGPVQSRLPKPGPEPDEDKAMQQVENVNDREEEAEKFVTKHTADWVTPELSSSVQLGKPGHHIDSVVIVTGATGSLGSHLIAGFAEHPDVKTVVCVNRRSSTAVETRQSKAFSSRGIELSAVARAKLRVLETDTSKPQLGLPSSEYTWLVQNGTHIVHSAWPMSGTRPLRGFEPQFQALRNLLDLAREMALRDKTLRIGFQLVSSIGVVGHAGEPRVIERRVPMDAVLHIGYCEAKWTCERMLDETLHKFPSRFRTMVVRPGQIAGSRTSGFWNPVEHFVFLVKSSQSLRAWPDFDGVLQWVPVNDVADTMVDLLAIGEADAPEPYPVYHIDNPIGQPWKQMSPILADALDIPPNRILPFRDWVKLVRRAPLQVDTENPASRLIDFLANDFERMSCGGLILDTTKVKEHSKTMATEGPVSAEVARLYVTAWKKMGYLRA
ncbi:hypothetical protein F4804DRAFT_350683 [Jackrogersella minutella]|nr:hypothetical protein F4804DRAFT_350683 [Jackrogersella minutella]